MEKTKQTFFKQQPKVTVCESGRIMVCLNEVEKDGIVGMAIRDGGGLELSKVGNMKMCEYDVYWIDPSESPIVPDMDAEILALKSAKEEILAEITAYDASDAVNVFTINGKKAWLDKATRVGLQNSVTILKDSGRDEMLLWIRDVSIETTCDKVLQFLAELEIYAVGCFNATAGHKQAVSELDDIGEVLEYDYKSGYPEMLDVIL